MIDEQKIYSSNYLIIYHWLDIFTKNWYKSHENLTSVRPQTSFFLKNFRNFRQSSVSNVFIHKTTKNFLNLRLKSALLPFNSFLVVFMFNMCEFWFKQILKKFFSFVKIEREKFVYNNNKIIITSSLLLIKIVYYTKKWIN